MPATPLNWAPPTRSTGPRAVALRVLARGGTLRQAAQAAGMPSDELDRLLWRKCGESS